MTPLERDEGPALPEGFANVARHVYRADPHWIPEEPGALGAAFSPANPWFETGRSIALCAPSAARLAAFLEPARLVDGRLAAFFGYWETVGVPEVDRTLFAEAKRWARAEGADDLYGPINFSTYGTYRLRLSAEPGALPFPGEPYNPPSYPQILEEQGFVTHQAYVTQVGDLEIARTLREAKRRVLETVIAKGYRIESLSPETWLSQLEQLHSLADAIFGGNFAYRPLGWPAFARACGESFAARACPHTSIIAYAPDGAVAGVFLVYPHYGPKVIQSALNRVDQSALRFGLHHHGLRGAVAKTVGVAPAHRGQGLMDAMTVAMLDRGEGRYDQWLGALIRDDNPSARFGKRVTRRRVYALYRKRLR